MLKTYGIYLLLLLAAFLRLKNAGTYGLHGDEMYTLLVSHYVSQEGSEQGNVFRQPSFTNIEAHAARNASNFLTAIARRDNGSGAVYAASLSIWLQLVGNSDTAMRSFSILCNLLLLFSLYFFIKKWFKKDSLALLVVFLGSISPFFITFSQVARTYSLVFLLALWCSHAFLICLSKDKFSNWHVLYGLLAFLLLMAHYSAFPLLGMHAVYALLFHFHWKKIAYLAISAFVPILGMLGWFNSPGGEWAFHSVEVSKLAYMEQAKTSSDPFLQLSTPKTIFKQILQVLMLSFPPLEAVKPYLHSMKDLLFAVFGGSIIWFRFRAERGDWKNFLSILILSILFLYIFPENGLALLFLAFAISLGIYATESIWKASRIYFFPLLLFLGSLLCLVLFAILDGNTFRMMPRYSGFAYVFGLILWGGVLWKSWNSNLTVRTILLVQLSLFGYFTLERLSSVYADRNDRYFHHLEEPRVVNPYSFIAARIQEKYSTGDTVLICSKVFAQTDTGYDMPEYSVQDAQYINLYLPKKDVEIVQKIDTLLKDKVILLKSDGSKEEIFDFQQGKFRY